MRHLLLLALAAVSAASFASVGRAASGTYRLVPDDATRAFCRRHRIELPTGKLVLREDRTFSLVVTDDEGTHRTEGRYSLRDDEVSFSVEEGEGLDLPQDMRLDDDRLEGERGCFERVEEPRPVRRPAVKVPRAPEPPVVEAPVRRARVESVAGTWTLRRNGNEDRSTRFTFNADGTFRFVGMNAQSRGRYECDGYGIELIWTEIDGEPVRGQTVRKRIPVDPDGFYVDDYRYERQR